MLLQIEKFHFFMAEYILLCVYICHSFSIHSSVNGCWPWFHSLAFVNNVSLNIGVHILMTYWISVLLTLDIYPGVELLNPMVVLAQMVKCLSAMLETRVQFLGWEDPLEKEMATHSGTLAWKIPWTVESGRLQSMGSQRVGHDWMTWLYFMVILFLSTWGTVVLFSLEAGLIYIANNSILTFSFQCILLTLDICYLFDSTSCKMCEVIVWFWCAFIRLVQK